MVAKRRRFVVVSPPFSPVLNPAFATALTSDPIPIPFQFNIQGSEVLVSLTIEGKV
jgi:hypothetical protein